MRVIISIVFFMQAFCLYSQKISATVQHKIKEDAVSFEISYINSSPDTMVLWIQDWRMILLEGRDDRFVGFPHTDSPLNFFVVMDAGLELEKQLSEFEYTTTSVGFSRIESYRKLSPRDTFRVEILSRDSKLISFVTKNHVKYALFIGSARESDVRKMRNAEYGYFLGKNIFIDDLPVSPNTPSGIKSKIFQFSDKVLSEPIYYEDVENAFSLYLRKNIRPLK